MSRKGLELLAKTVPFDRYPERYDEWFDENRSVYASELEAVRRLLPEVGLGLEVGVGTGRFAEALGIRLGIDPSFEMLKMARQRGLSVAAGQAEKLPFADNAFDFVLMVTVICFLDDVEAAFREAERVLRPGGSLITAFIDKDSPLGKSYEARKGESPFYRDATFYSAKEVSALLEKASFGGFTFVQTVFHALKEIKAPEPVKEGYGEGSFVAVRGFTSKEKTF